MRPIVQSIKEVKVVTRSDLLAEMHKVSILLMSAHSELRRKYGLSPDFVNEDDKQAHDTLVSTLEGWMLLDNAHRGLNIETVC